MDKVNRRKFLLKFFAYQSSLIIGMGFLVGCTEDLLAAVRSGELEYLPIQSDNPAIARWSKRCEECGDCIEACAEKQKVFGTYNASKTKHVCIHCGTCIMKCEEGALTEKYNWQEVLDAIDNPSKIVIASTSPSVRVGIGDYFGMASGTFLAENMVGGCRSVGFDYVLDTNFSADLTIMEEANELLKRMNEKVDVPLFTSCCPAWVTYVEIYYPGLLKNISTSKSPISMQGAMIKTYFAQKKGLDPRNIIHVAITPCTAKKFEIMRKELSSDGMSSTDFAITTKELSLMFKKRNINLLSQKGSFDSFMGAASGGGLIFGNTGGVMSRTAYFMVAGINPPANLLELHEVQGLSGLKEAQVSIGTSTLQVAVCYEMRNAKTLLDQVRSGTCKYHFIEVMACKGGCVGGAGQPTNNSNIEKRMAALNDADALAVTRYSHENKEVKAAYKDFLGDVGGKLAKKYLHTTYSSKADLLGL
jgi:iron-only hydrogenase group A